MIFSLTLTLMFAQATCISEYMEGVSLSKCSQPFRFIEPKELITTINLRPENATLKTTASYIKVTAAKVTKFSAYCKDSFTGMWQSGNMCSRDTKYIKYSESQMREVNRRQLCLVGRSCTLDTCYSDMTRHCKEDILEEWRTPRSTGIQIIGKKMVYYSCYLEWDCKIQEITVPVYGDSDSGQFYFHLDSSKKIWLKETSHSAFEQDWNLWIPGISVTEVEESIPCLGSKTHIVCDVPSNPPNSILITKSGRGAINNWIVQTKSKTNDYITVEGNPTMEQLAQITSDLIEEDLKNKYNFKVMRHEMNDIWQRLFNAVINNNINGLSGIKEHRNETIMFLAHNEFSICEKGPRNLLTLEGIDEVRQVNFYSENPLYTNDLSTTLTRDDYMTRKFQEIERLIKRKEGSLDTGDVTKSDNDKETWQFGISHIIEYVKLYGSLCGIAALILVLAKR